MRVSIVFDLSTWSFIPVSRFIRYVGKSSSETFKQNPSCFRKGNVHLVVLVKSQPTKNRNLINVFTLLQQQEVLVCPVIFPG
jgi:diaminopimelate epimerase